MKDGLILVVVFWPFWWGVILYGVWGDGGHLRLVGFVVMSNLCDYLRGW